MGCARSRIRHCEERSDEAIQERLAPIAGLLRCARNDDHSADCETASVDCSGSAGPLDAMRHSAPAREAMPQKRHGCQQREIKSYQKI